MSILDLFRLDGKVAIITGAGRGIGAATAKAYAEAGADVVLAARTLEQLEQTAEIVRSSGRKALVVQTDVLVAEQLENLLKATLDTFGRVDILVNNAGGWRPQAALQTSVKDFENCFRFNVTTAFAMTRLTVPEMINSTGGGAVIN
ncbi:MAG: SDR family NAD(P)-dependent oxidoreductase, partial [Pseudomonadales bacterium]